MRQTDFIIILVVVFILFGHRLPSIMRSLGRGVVNFRTDELYEQRRWRREPSVSTLDLWMIGGGIVLDPVPPLRRAAWPAELRSPDVQVRLQALLARRPAGIHEQALPQLSGLPPRSAAACAQDRSGRHHEEDHSGNHAGARKAGSVPIAKGGQTRAVPRRTHDLGIALLRGAPLEA